MKSQELLPAERRAPPRGGRAKQATGKSASMVRPPTAPCAAERSRRMKTWRASGRAVTGMYSRTSWRPGRSSARTSTAATAYLSRSGIGGTPDGGVGLAAKRSLQARSSSRAVSAAMCRSCMRTCFVQVAEVSPFRAQPGCGQSRCAPRGGQPGAVPRGGGARGAAGTLGCAAAAAASDSPVDNGCTVRPLRLRLPPTKRAAAAPAAAAAARRTAPPRAASGAEVAGCIASAHTAHANHTTSERRRALRTQRR